jgi:capsular exopolysaccharide synthesis family protein
VQDDTGTLNLEQALAVLRRRALLIVLCVVVATGVAYGFSKQETKKYTATASLAFSSNSLSQQIAGLSAGASSNSSLLAQQASNLQLVRLGDMAAKTASWLGYGLTEEKVAASLSIGSEGESGVVAVSATASSPTLSAEIANTYTRQFVEEQQSANREYFKSAQALVSKQLAELSPQQRVGPDGLELQDRGQTLRLLSELDYGSVKVAEEALPPTRPSSPKTSRNTVLGVLLGLLVGLGLAFVSESLDGRVRRPEDLEAIYRVPALGLVPESPALSPRARHDGAKGAALPSAEAEIFSLIRAHLRFLTVDRDLRTVVIASAAPSDGRTTIARHLAEAAARLGSRVLLLEADLRHPTLAQQLGIQSRSGLADVLIGAVLMDEATQSVDLEAPSGPGGEARTLDVLVAGAVVPPNPAELLEGDVLDAVLEWAKSAYDLVVIDTPPLTVVSDAFSLLTKVDGVVIVGCVGRSRRDAAERLHQVLASSGAPVLGVVANGSRSGGPGSRAYARGGSSSPAVASANGASASEEILPTVKV